MACDKWRAKVRELINAIRCKRAAERVECQCRCCVRCLKAWIEDMENQRSERKLQADSHFFATFGQKALTTKQVKEEFRWLNTPQVEAACSEMFYNDYVAKLCYTLEMLDTDAATVKLPTLMPMTLDATQLELTNALDEYIIQAQGRGDRRLLQLLSGVAFEMQRYGNGKDESMAAVHSRIITKCQAFMLRYKDLQRYQRNLARPINSFQSKHKKYNKLLDNIQQLKHSFEQSQLKDMWDTQLDPPDDGEDEFIEHKIYRCGPYCTCERCKLSRGYTTVQLDNLQQTIKMTVNLNVEKQDANCDSRSEDSDEDEYSSSEDWFHYTDLEDSSTTSDTNTSDIEVNVPYHKVMRPRHDHIQQGRKSNKEDTAGVEQRLILPNITKDHSSFRLSNMKVYSEFDDKVVVSRNQYSKFQKKIRKRFTKDKPNFIHWRVNERAVVNPPFN